MKTLSITQPWASLVALGEKRVETRSWCTNYRGVLAIHASKGFPKAARDICLEEPFRNVLLKHKITGLYKLPLGQVIAVGRLVDVLPTEPVGCLSSVFEEYPELENNQELAFGDFSPKRWAWVIEGIAPVGPWDAKGALGLWDWKQGDL